MSMNCDLVTQAGVLQAPTLAGTSSSSGAFLPAILLDHLFAAFLPHPAGFTSSFVGCHMPLLCGVTQVTCKHVPHTACSQVGAGALRRVLPTASEAWHSKRFQMKARGMGVCSPGSRRVVTRGWAVAGWLAVGRASKQGQLAAASKVSRCSPPRRAAGEQGQSVPTAQEGTSPVRWSEMRMMRAQPSTSLCTFTRSPGSTVSSPSSSPTNPARSMRGRGRGVRRVGGKAGAAGLQARRQAGGRAARQTGQAGTPPRASDASKPAQVAPCPVKLACLLPAYLPQCRALGPPPCWGCWEWIPGRRMHRRCPARRCWLC